MGNENDSLTGMFEPGEESVEDIAEELENPDDSEEGIEEEPIEDDEELDEEEESEGEDDDEDSEEDTYQRLAALELERETEKALKEESESGKREEAPKGGEIPQLITEEESQRIVEEFEQGRTDTLNSVMFKGLSAAIQHIQQKMPQVVSGLIQDNLSRATTVQRFYEENPDLRNHGNLVSLVAQRLAKENPSKKADEILKEAAGHVRQRLRIEAKKENKKPSKKKKKAKPTGQPAPAGRSGGPGTKKKAPPAFGAHGLDDMFQ